ncbi:hypothetical protein THASP1DRAFT_27439 [Thamnocephalis sphaerospora]|uniref:Uncharacterized protein n=1 Tax=Thamnocephalis sphaerospora TaxID=78915 RepID=A0A4P9XWM8_9FUNG|nr:hypothetical protein THASP1DRAFT_27439 [Thamnocephalis sphaerospora]|eukprot:RKP10785.1 hypothetical protein THASP1DRAFT_27439 [Thamnocephalis sphaerospora]
MSAKGSEHGKSATGGSLARECAALRDKFPSADFEIVAVSDAGFPMAVDGREMHLIETAPKERRWLSEEQVWELKRQRKGFMDVTFQPNLSSAAPNS